MAEKRWRIAIIDDSPEDCALARRALLQGSGRRYEFIEAATGASGLEKCQEAALQAPLDCVLLDFSLPDMDAIEVLNAMTTSEGDLLYPVVVLTGSDSGHGRSHSLMRAGAQDYVGKSWMTPESLTRSVENAVERWSMLLELHARKERFVRAQRAARIGTWDWDIATGMAHWTEEAYRLFGRNPAEATPVSYDFWLESLHPDDRVAAAENVKRSLVSGSYRDEFRVLLADGGVRWLESLGEVSLDESGRALRLLGTVQDISERKRSADILLERDQRLRLALRASGTGVWSWDVASGAVTWSDEAFAILGLTRTADSAELRFEDFTQRLHDEDRGRVLESIRRTLATGSEYKDEFRIVRDDGSVRLVTNLGLVQRDEQALPRMMIGTIIDVTDAREQEAELRRHQHELQTLADNTPDILARFDRRLRHTFVNVAVERVTGLPCEAFIGKTNRDLGMPAALCDQWDDVIESVFETGQPRSFEFDFEGPQGRHHYASKVVPERGPSGSVDFALSVAHDITVLKKAEATLREADRRKDMFLAILAHELRNPLMPIRTGLEVLKSGPDNPAQTRVIAMLERQVGQLVRLIDDLSDVSRIASGKIAFQREWLCLQDVVTACLETTRATIERSKHSLEVECPAEPIRIHGDAARLTQVLANLLNNAAKYTPKGGLIRLSLHCTKGEVRIDVSDSGVGIAPDMVGRVFDMFMQVDHTLEQSQGGLGIGLALVKNLVELHGGAVRAHSEGIGMGSTFSVTLPLVASAALEPPQHLSARDC